MLKYLRQKCLEKTNELLKILLKRNPKFKHLGNLYLKKKHENFTSQFH